MNILRTLYLFVCIAALGLSCVVSASAQSGKLKVKVVTIEGKKIKGVAVTVEGNGVTRKLVSNKAGEFKIELPAGIYTLILEKRGFAKLTATNVEVVQDTRRDYQIPMHYSRSEMPWTLIESYPEQLIKPQRE